MKPQDYPDYPVVERPALELPSATPQGGGTANTIRKLIRQVKSIRDTLLRNWILILSLTVIGWAGGWWYDVANKEPARYLARYTFNLETQSASPMGGFGDMASMFGLGGGSVDNGLFSGENFYILFQSRPLMERTLLRKVDIRNHKNVLLANFYILKSGIRDKEWKDSKPYETFLFDPNKPRSKYTRKEVSALAQLMEKIKANMALGQVNKKSSFIEFGVGTEDETLSMLLADGMMETIKEFYQTNKTRKTLEVLELARKRRDSLKAALYSNESQLARYMDQNAGLVVAAPQVTQQRLSRNSQLAGSMYTDALRNVETIQASLIRETPLVTIIDSPVLPLAMEAYEGRAKKFAPLLGFFLAVAFVMLRKTYRELMKE
jgi:hypothetical protein